MRVGTVRIGQPSLGKISRRLARAQPITRVRIARELVRQITTQTKRIRELETELTDLVKRYAPQLLAERGCGALTAAKLIGEIAGADRFMTDAQLARTSGAAPIPASSGNTTRHRLDRGGNRQLNCALHRLAVNKGNWDPDAAAYLAPNKPKANHAKKRCAASNATSPVVSGNSCDHRYPQPRRLPSR